MWLPRNPALVYVRALQKREPLPRAIAQNDREFVNKITFIRDRRFVLADGGKHGDLESANQFQQDFAVFFTLS
jgi:hypothetical protein